MSSKDYISGEFVFNDTGSKKEYIYQDVLDDFKNAKNIYISTYGLGISLKFINELEKAKNAKIILIDNIPNLGHTESEKLKTIDEELEKFDIEKYKNIELYFNQNNHTKIIATDNILYFGSQNFTVGSKYNYEVGIIIKDKVSIGKVIEKFNIIKNNSVKWYDGEYVQAYEYLNENIEQLERILNEIETTISNVDLDKINNYISNRVSGFYKFRSVINTIKLIGTVLDYEEYIIEIRNILEPNKSMVESDIIKKILNKILEENIEVRDTLKLYLNMDINISMIYELFNISDEAIKSKLDIEY